jgi:hypothetical protein
MRELEKKLKAELIKNTPLKDVKVSEEKDRHDGITLVRIDLMGEDWKDGFSTNHSDDIYNEIIQECYNIVVEHEEGKTIF